MFFRFIIFEAIISIKASFNSHKQLIKSLILAPINLFYDITPTGRILNRLSKDINVIDEEVGSTWGDCASSIVVCIACTSMGILFFPYLIILIPVIIFPGRMISKIYINISRELTRLESISRSPIVNSFKEALSGSKFIRVFNQAQNFIDQNQEKIDCNTKINYSISGCQQWMRLYLELLSASLIITLYFLAILFRNDVSSAVVGLCLSYLIPLPEEVNHLIINFTHLENVMVSVERVKSFTEINSEQPMSMINDLKNPKWPISPCIKFHKVKLRYRPNTDLVLKGVNFNIPASSRVGIAGRTGSGKSSIFLALLRIVELYEGIITIDGINIALLGLKKLRESITLIPQDPLVFNGTMRDNLDPLHKFSDEELKNVLNDVSLKIDIEHELKNSGKNISIGERQLLSLSRALICNTKIILFDEATAGIDPENDARIQNILKNKFIGCTILTIAHRLETIEHSDFFILLEDGKVSKMGVAAEVNLYGIKID